MSIETKVIPSFFERSETNVSTIPVGEGVQFGFERVHHSPLGIGGAYGTWGKCYDNQTLPEFVSMRMGQPMGADDVMNLSELGFNYRHHIPDLSPEEHLTLELEVGTRLLKEAAAANGWSMDEVDGVLIGMSAPVSENYVAEIARRAGVPERALKVSVHKACDGSSAALHLALNPALGAPGSTNVAEELRGKKVLVGGIEGLSRFTSHAKDKNALQLFGNGAGVIGIVPGESMKLIAGQAQENYDEEGLLAVHMYYPHSHERIPGRSMLEITQENAHHLRIAGLMHEPEDGSAIEMAGLMGMVKLFVRTGVQVVTDVYRDYRAEMDRQGRSERNISVGVVHHANYKINLLKAKHLQKDGISYPMPWLLSEFGNISAGSNMIAFLRQLPHINPGDHIIVDGFGAGTYYDAMALEMGG